METDKTLKENHYEFLPTFTPILEEEQNI